MQLFISVFLLPFSAGIYQHTNAAVTTVEISVCLFALRLTAAWN